MRRDLQRERRVATLVFFEAMSVDGNRCRRHRALKVHKDALPSPLRRCWEMAAISRNVLKISFLKTVPGQVYVCVWKSDFLPVRIVMAWSLKPGDGLASE